MSVTIDPNIKKQRIFIDKNGKQITEEQLFAGNIMGHDMGTNKGTDNGGEKEKSPTT